MIAAARATALAGAGTLAALSALHVSWALGSHWPAADAGELGAIAAGTDRVPGPGPCLAVATGLAAAGALVAGAGGRRAPVQLARAGVAAGFAVRGLAGLTGTTRHLVGWTPSERFARLDRRRYGPLCCAIALAAALSLVGPPDDGAQPKAA